MKFDVDIAKLREEYSLPTHWSKESIEDFWNKVEKIVNSNKRTHLAIGIYANQSYKYNVVLDEHIISNMICNINMRPGRWYFVDGYCINIGYGEKKVFEKIAKDFYDSASISINLTVATIPYQ